MLKEIHKPYLCNDMALKVKRKIILKNAKKVAYINIDNACVDDCPPD